MNHPVASHEAWFAASKELLAKEKELTSMRDELSRMRRALPWVKIEKHYEFDSSAGKKSLSDLFDGLSQLASTTHDRKNKPHFCISGPYRFQTSGRKRRYPTRIRGVQPSRFRPCAPPPASAGLRQCAYSPAQSPRPLSQVPPQPPLTL